MLFFKDFLEWKELNKDSDFSFYDYLYHIMKLKSVNTDIFFAFGEIFCPTFIKYKNFILLKENFSEKKIKELIIKKENVEYWMNLFMVDPYFEQEEDGDLRAEHLSKILVDNWKSKLEKDFPNKAFIVKYLYDEEQGDYGLTFYQK